MGTVAAFLAAVSPLLAQPAATPLIDHLSGGSRPERFLFFSGLDLWRNGKAGYGGMVWAPHDLNKDGPLLRLFLSDDFERYDTPGQRYNSTIFRGSILPGWRIKRGDVEIKVFTGLAVENRVLAPDNPADRLHGTQFGARMTAELWWQPTRATMLAANASATTIGSEYSARAAAGWRLLDRFWAGPEVSISSDAYSTQYRFGAHITGLKTGTLEWSVATGFVEDSFQRNGIYGRLGVFRRQ
jgi:hypothetical protein